MQLNKNSEEACPADVIHNFVNVTVADSWL